MRVSVHLKILEVDDVTQAYVDWFSDPKVIEFSDNQYRQFSLAEQRRYVEEVLKRTDTDLFGIFDGSLHIGNLVISDFLSVHRRAEITYVVGERAYWGKGVASEAISQIINKAKNEYKLNKLFAGCADGNEGSKRVLMRNGFELEGVRKGHLFYNNAWMDQCDFGLIL